MTDGSSVWNPNLADDYDRIAEAYVDGLERSPFDRDLLDRFTGVVQGCVCDVGCGPGFAAGYLRSRPVNVFGIDLSLRMIEVARRLNPGIWFVVGDMRTFPVSSGVLAGIVSFYSIIHLRREAVVPALREMSRVLHPGGCLLLACQRGREDIHADERFGRRISLDATLFEPAELVTYLEKASFQVEQTLTRKPYDFEVPMEKVYLLAKKRSVAG